MLKIKAWFTTNYIHVKAWFKTNLYSSKLDKLNIRYNVFNTFIML